MQSALLNLMDGPDMPAKFRNVFLTIREPYSTPEERVGQKAIDITKESIRENFHKIQRRKKRRPRARR
jgi:hypothetical protein